MFIPTVDETFTIRVCTRVFKHSKIAFIAVIIGLVILLISGIVAGISGIGPMNGACGSIALATTVAVFLSMIALLNIIKNLMLFKEQRAFKKLKKIFYDRRSECKKKADRLKQKLVVRGSFIGFSTTFPNQKSLSLETVELLEEYMYILPSMHTHLMQLMRNYKDINSIGIISFYKECMEVATLVRELAIMSVIGVETGVVDLTGLPDVRNLEFNSLVALIYYPEALEMCFEREFECLDLDLTRVQTREFKEFPLRDVLGDNANHVIITNREIDLIKEHSLLQLERLLLVIDETSKTVDKFDNSCLMQLVDYGQPVRNLYEYNRVINSILSSLLYHEVCSRSGLECMPENIMLKK